LLENFFSRACRFKNKKKGFQKMTTTFAVTYKALQTPTTSVDRAIVVARATAAMVSSRFVRKAVAAVFFKRCGDGANFTASSDSAEVLQALPATYGSVIGHFGEFERSEVYAQ